MRGVLLRGANTGLRKTNPPHRLDEVDRAASQVDFEPDLKQRQRPAIISRNPHRILFRGDDAFGPLPLRRRKDFRQVVLAETIVIEESLAANDQRAEVAEEFLE